MIVSIRFVDPSCLFVGCLRPRIIISIIVSISIANNNSQSSIE